MRYKIQVYQRHKVLQNCLKIKNRNNISLLHINFLIKKRMSKFYFKTGIKVQFSKVTQNKDSKNTLTVLAHLLLLTSIHSRVRSRIKLKDLKHKLQRLASLTVLIYSCKEKFSSSLHQYSIIQKYSKQNKLTYLSLRFRIEVHIGGGT